MKQRYKYQIAILVALSIITGCSGKQAETTPSASANSSVSPNPTSKPMSSPAATVTPSSSSPGATVTPLASSKTTTKPQGSQAPTVSPAATAGGTKNGSIAVIAKPDSLTALVNKQNSLPSDYEPSDLVYPDVAFVFSEKIEKRKMRKEAAGALEKLFAGAKKDGISLAGVSAYRSYATQKSVFQRYVLKDGEEKAKTYSAVPGTSEHETGLAIDVTGSDGKCAAEDCFGGTKEANWLEKHASEYGFIIRYPKGKAAITGYQYEPWHIRYVGTDLSKEIVSKNVTMEEYFKAVPVTK
ncbi:D-alanyl-D-alanine carboxypeptidase family protein [Paenibacillus sp. N3.4]|uniref:D-alanyl-D-alanine carboxypeptidase family protein n=1 Tax=Paenibacillus sp. N3.4 TaxID=2603222 RepID=UPI0011C7A179|nr:D-alanyl-D-alanine carboxypeptidase family protein [Paenibacillus sp. N3.4]TXK80065.1 D-alanyl-D-alanine carboxypeptidase family protein [Paenibacillus sp. N3.4]